MTDYGKQSPEWIVGLGASAGGIEAIQVFVHELEVKSRAAFILVQHLSPDFKSFMPEIVARKTELNVVSAEDGQILNADTLYILPPDKSITIEKNRISLQPSDRSHLPVKPIDLLFTSLGREYKERSIGIIFSGTGSDGAEGILDIHNEGGLAMVQSPESSKFDGMPNSAINTGIIDTIDSPEDLARKVNISLQGETEKSSQHELKKIFSLVYDKYSVDFSRYKPATVKRRLERRLAYLNLRNLSDYIEHLEANPDEIVEAYYDILISVTQMFRDREAFDYMKKEVIPAMFEESKENILRVWVPGCASGEEAYSLAILIFEVGKELGQIPRVKIFATDIDDIILNRAAEGKFSPESLEHVPEDLLLKYFSRDDDFYYISPHLRNSIVFARHNCLEDPPFTNLDLISCRNLLIYLNQESQETVMSYFYFGLKENGHLFLGPSESVGKLEAAFTKIQTKWKIFKKRNRSNVGAIFQNFKGMNTEPLTHFKRPKTSSKASPEDQELNFLGNSFKQVYEHLMGQFVKACLIINSDLKVFHSFGYLNDYVKLRDGLETHTLRNLLAPRVLTSIQITIKKVITQKKSMDLVEFDEDKKRLVMKLVPLGENGNHIQFFALTFLDREVIETESKKSSDDDSEKATNEKIDYLEQELEISRETLQTTIEELETTNEELQSTNEELLASNEELQSTNEELHSVNEELYTVNSEYQNKIEDLSTLKMDEENFFNATKLAAVFVDKGKLVKKITPSAHKYFNVIAQDIGRPLEHLSHNFRQLELLPSLASILSKEEGLIEIEAETKEGVHCFVRMNPYLAEREIVEGVIITVVELSHHTVDQ